jgi:hypothetical protein
LQSSQAGRQGRGEQARKKAVRAGQNKAGRQTRSLGRYLDRQVRTVRKGRASMEGGWTNQSRKAGQSRISRRQAGRHGREEEAGRKTCKAKQAGSQGR